MPRHRRTQRTEMNRNFGNAMDRTRSLLNNTHFDPYARDQFEPRRTPSPPAYEPPPAYPPKPKLYKRFKNIFTRKKTQVRPLTPPPVYSLPYQQPRTYGQNAPTYQPGGRKIRKTKKRRSHKLK